MRRKRSARGRGGGGVWAGGWFAIRRGVSRAMRLWFAQNGSRAWATSSGVEKRSSGIFGGHSGRGSRGGRPAGRELEGVGISAWAESFVERHLFMVRSAAGEQFEQRAARAVDVGPDVDQIGMVRLRRAPCSRPVPIALDRFG